ncbi:MAG: L-seryl-tRNA(Sec) selenium transferase [Armatimonadetes bacterium]|nr:L-seryl-tRNA(Sec) selenium transferase [Armatimonadota bacterium]
MAREELRNLPSVANLIAAPELAAFSHRTAVLGAREALKEAREAQNGKPSADRILERAAEIAERSSQSAYGPAINCTGTILNTGLGRARLAKAAVEAIANSAGSHTVLELDLETGRRGNRQTGLENLLCELTGAEAAFVVNNNAAAVMITINTLACGMEVLLSRGQSVEIGGSFRMPDVIRGAGGNLVDVGCTNRTRASDYASAVTEDTAAILRCHPSNFTITGFVEEPAISELAEVAAEHELALIDDVGSGCLMDTAAYGLPHEPTLADSLQGGAHLVTASGDKLLGGPQAGIILGKREIVERVRKNPVARAVRIDKQTAAGLEATLKLYADGREGEIPTIAYLSRSDNEVRALGNKLSKKLAEQKVEASVEIATCEIGAGSLPGVSLPSYRLAITTDYPDGFARSLRMFRPAVVGYIGRGKVCLDMRTVDVDELPAIEKAIAAAVRG